MELLIFYWFTWLAMTLAIGIIGAASNPSRKFHFYYGLNVLSFAAASVALIVIVPLSIII